MLPLRSLFFKVRNFASYYNDNDAHSLASAFLAKAPQKNVATATGTNEILVFSSSLVFPEDFLSSLPDPMASKPFIE